MPHALAPIQAARAELVHSGLPCHLHPTPLALQYMEETAEALPLTPLTLQ
jgi:hypothetical protein